MDNHNETPQLSTITLPETFEMIPAELRDLRQWVCWRFEQKAGEKKPRKVPIIAGSGRSAKVSESTTWSDFDSAWRAAKASSGTIGIGFVFTKDDPYFGIDLDHAIAETGELLPEAQQIIDNMASYAEVSPSGSGVKLIVKAAKPASARSRSDVLGPPLVVELFDQGRYFTITGKCLDADIALVPERQREVDELCKRLWPSKSLTKFAPAGSAADYTPRRGADAVARCKAYLATCPDAISGEGGHNRTYHAACVCYRFGLSDDQALEVMRWYNHTKTGGEQWTDAALLHKLNGARESVESDRAVGIMLRPAMNTAAPSQSPQETTSIFQYSMPDEEITRLSGDIGNARRFVNAYGTVVRFHAQSKHWLIWDSTRWKRDEAGAVLRFAKDVALQITTDFQKGRSGLDMKWVADSRKIERLRGMLKAAEPDVVVASHELDADPWLFNCENGTLNLRTGELYPHDPTRLITKLAPVRFDPDATCPIFDQFIADVFCGDNELISFVQRFLGYCLTGDISEQYLPIFHGEGGNGKSVLLDTVAGLMGDYAATAPPSLLTVKRNEEHPTEIADLLGRRMVVASETEQGAELRVQLVKRLTGDEKLKARHMRQDFFEFARTHKTILVTNNLPVLRESTEAVWRRLRFVPFDYIVPEEKRDTKLLSRLKTEYPGILAWLVRGAMDWRTYGLPTVAAIKAATDELRTSTAAVDAFIDQRCVRSSDGFLPAANLTSCYERWCDDQGCSPLEGRALGAALRKAGCEPVRQDGVRGWRGIAIRRDNAGDAAN